jgi:hypothetical protein
MIKLFFVSFYFYVKAIIFAIFAYKKEDALFYSGKDLFYKLSFRNSKEKQKDIFFSLRCLKKMFFRILFTKNSFREISESGIAVVDALFLNNDLRLSYIDYFTKQEPSLFIAKNELQFGFNFIHKIFLVFMLLILSPVVILLSLTDIQKQRWPMILNEFFEYVCLAWLLNKKKIKAVCYFCIYEKDSNIVAWLLMRQNIYVNKIPSEVPLYFFNQVIVANQLSFCFAYQQEEFNAFKKTMFVTKTEQWGPEQILTAPARFFKERGMKKPVFDIGFFSSGNWLRAQLGDIDLGHHDKENEELILRGLIKYSQDNNLLLRLFLHPIEKKIENRIACEKYYFEFSEIKNLSIADYNNPSIEGFDEVNIGVSVYSTLMFERIYLGFKTIIAPFDYDEFPIKQSSLNQICVHNMQQLYAKLDINLKLTTIDFFQKNHISKYSTFIN